MLRVLSEIYPTDMKPARDGWYLGVRSPNLTWALYEWQQGRWWFAEAGREAESPVLFWRGLAFDPAAAVQCEGDIGSIESQRSIVVDGAFLPGAVCE